MKGVLLVLSVIWMVLFAIAYWTDRPVRDLLVLGVLWLQAEIQLIGEAA